MSKRIANYHTFVDRLQALLRTHAADCGQSVTCARCCSACCFEPVYVHEKEARHAFERVPAEHADGVRQRAVAWFEAAAQALRSRAEINVVEYRKLRAACPFLHEHQCLVYDARPTGCRLHLALGPRERCEQDELRPSQQYASSPEGLTMVGIAALEACKGKLETDHLGVFIYQFVTGQRCETADRVSRQIDSAGLDAKAAKRIQANVQSVG